METKNKAILDELSKRKFFKLDLKSLKNKLLINNLTYLFTLSGCSAIDIEYNPEMQETINKSIIKALNDSKKYITNQIQLPFLIISFKENILDFQEEKLSSLINNSMTKKSDVIELHIDQYNLNRASECLEKIRTFSINKVLSISLNRDKLSNSSIIEIIKSAKEFAGRNLIIEINGNYESENKNYYNNSLQTLSTADIIFKQIIKKDFKFRKLPILVSGGTNSFTKELANQCGINYNGITFSEFVIDMIPDKYLKEPIIFNDDLFLEIKRIKSFIKRSLQN